MSRTIDGCSWCDNRLQYCNEDFCCNAYKRNSNGIGLAIASIVITLIVILALWLKR